MDNKEGISGGRGDSSFQPLLPPPEPPSKLYEDDDFDLYADIEAPNPSKLAPPPEPPAMLFALDGDDKDEEEGGGGSDEDAGLVIDDRHDAYDPEMPTSPPSPTPSERRAEEEKRQKKKKKRSAIPAPIYPALEDIPPPPSPPPSGCPNQGLYSKISQEIAKRKRIESDDSDNDDDDLHLSLPRPPTPPFGTLNLSLKSGKFERTLDEAREQTVPEDLGNHKNASIGEEEDIDGVPLEDIAIDGVPLDEIALPENEPVVEIDSEPNGDGSIHANNSADSDAEPAADAFSEPPIILPEPKSPEESSEVVKSKDLSDGELEEDENEPDEVVRHKESDDEETSKKSPKPDTVPLQSAEKLRTDDDKVQELLDVLNGTDESEKPVENGKSSSAVSKGSSDERDDLLELEERDGLVDITDEEISNYEKSWEMEENGKRAGLDGLETEAISDNEYPPGESDAAEEQRMSFPKKPEAIQGAPDSVPVENGRSGEEGEIMTEDRHPVQWKKLSKTTKERSYRGDKEMSKKEANKEITKKKEKRKELERYDVRKLISEKPRRKVDEFGRDISSHSRSNSRSPSRGRRSLSRGKKRRSRSRSRSKERVRSKERNKERSKSRSRSKEKRRERSKEKSKERRSTSRSKKKRRSRTPVKKDRARSREKTSRERKKRKKSPSMSCSSCSCSSCEREKRRSKKLTVIVTNEEVGKRKEKKKKDKKSSPKNRRRSSPVPSKEVFTSGDNILVSVNFKSSKSGESRKESSKRRKDDENKKKKDKGTKENQPVRSIVTAKKSKKKLNTRNIKPVAIIDLDASPFREVLSPKEIIILTDSDSEDKRPQQENPVPVSITGPKTPPEPLIKFNIVNNKQQSLRTMANPLMDALMEQLEDELEDEGDDVEGNEIPHKGPNTPPEPPVPYDPFEPTKSRSPSPVEAQMDRSSPPEAQQTEQVPQTPPKLPQHVAPKTPSPLHSPPKPADEPAEKPKLHPFQPAGDSGNDSPGGGGGGGGGGDSPYSPGSSEGDDLFEPPMPQPGAALKTKSRIPPPPANIKQHLPLPKVTSKKRSKSHKDKKGSKKEIGIKLDEDQLKILDELPNSAVEMQVKDKASASQNKEPQASPDYWSTFLKKLNRQERVVEEVKMVLKPHYAKKHVTKEEYKEILRKAVPKICHSRSGEINPAKIHRLIEAYVKKYRHKSKKRGSAIPPLRQNKGQVKTLWC